jgi:cell division protein FtsB
MSCRRPRQIAILCALLLAASFVTPGIAEQAAPPAADKAVKTPEELVREYRRENEKLRARVKQLEAEVEALKKTRSITLAPQPIAPTAPPTWKPFQFNGATYYMVPLGTSGQAPAKLLTDAEADGILVAPQAPQAASGRK